MGGPWRQRGPPPKPGPREAHPAVAQRPVRQGSSDRTQDTAAATKLLGVADRPTDITDMAFVGAAIVVGALIGALVFKVAGPGERFHVFNTDDFKPPADAA